MDAGALMNYFRRCQVEDPNFFSLCKFDDENRVFGADSVCGSAYRYLLWWCNIIRCDIHLQKVSLCYSTFTLFTRYVHLLAQDIKIVITFLTVCVCRNRSCCSPNDNILCVGMIFLLYQLLVFTNVVNRLDYFRLRHYYLWRHWIIKMGAGLNAWMERLKNA